MFLSPYALDTFVSQRLSELTDCNPKNIANEFPEHKNWINSFILKKIFQNHISDKNVNLAFIQIRRADSALIEWELFCSSSRVLKTPLDYFTMLRHLENCLSSLWQGLEFCRKALGTDLFKQEDGDIYKRLNWIYNIGRHFDPNKLEPGDIHSLWISNEALNSRQHSVTFSEISEKIRLLSRIADRLAGNRE